MTKKSIILLEIIQKEKSCHQPWRVFIERDSIPNETELLNALECIKDMFSIKYPTLKTIKVKNIFKDRVYLNHFIYDNPLFQPFNTETCNLVLDKTVEEDENLGLYGLLEIVSHEQHIGWNDTYVDKRLKEISGRVV